ncbi:MAG: UDP-glucose/GDP-mannose dehydrogenase family protein [Bdellovibrionales bacterium]|nr:UDP-glucose/GDP-mannose dehydrogenase family protein [Bdellovibrionales bacterium]
MEIAVVGSGYVGLVAGACFADSGNEVYCVDKDEKKIEALLAGNIPIYEPGLKDIVARNAKNGRLKFTTSLQEGVEASQVIFIAVGTPPGEDGSADLSHVLAVASGIGKYMNGPKVIVDKSTVPVGTAKLVSDAIAKETSHDFEVVSNPEFLKEGAAIDDFMKPDRVVVGVPSEKSAQVMRKLYAPFVRTNNPILVMDVVSAEMTKYAANAMLATRISFMNEVSALCEQVGADVDQVRIGIGTDSRIGMSFLFPGIGYGGSCFPKDVQALIRTAHQKGLTFHVSEAVERVNNAQKRSLVEKVVKHYGSVEDLKGKHFAVWGLAFKPRTDDVREAPALVVIEELLAAGATVCAFDPEARHTFADAIGEHEGLRYSDTNYNALPGADALLICTEWNDFRHPNFEKLTSSLKAPVIFDGRNLFGIEDMKTRNFTYYSVGRPVVKPND